MGDIPKYVIGHVKSYNKYKDYSKSWDWLMPVLQKCLDVSNDDNIEDFYSIQNVVPNIEATYDAVLEFIKEYNNG